MTPLASITDLLLIAKFRRGDHNAFTALYDRHVQRIYRLMVRLSGDKDIADDLTQETFVSAYCSLSTYQGRSAFSTWLWGIGLNTYRNYNRFSRRIPPTESLGNGEPVPATTDSDPLNVCTRLHAEKALELAILALPTPAREAFVLVRVEGLAYQQAADLLDVPLGTLQSRLHRATSLLHRELSHLIYETEPVLPARAVKGAKNVI